MKYLPTHEPIPTLARITQWKPIKSVDKGNESKRIRNQLNISKVAAIKILSNVGDIYTAHADVGNEYHALNHDESRIP